MQNYSYQLYSSRNFQPWPETFSMLKEVGYTQVEGFGALFEDLDKLGSTLQANGLTMSSTHVSLESLETDVAAVIEQALRFGIKSVYCPYLAPDDRPVDADGYLELGQRLQKVGEALTKAGLGFGWHNHDFEFQLLPDGSTPMQRIFEGGPNLQWEADIAWIVRGGADPLEWIAKEGHRISAVHIKDLSADSNNGEDGWADVGHGTMDWKALLQTLANHDVRHFVVEHDNPSDATRFATRSLAFLRSHS